MKMNTQGSGFLSGLFLVLLAIMLTPHLGLELPWTPRTTPYRLAHAPLAGWSLAIAMGAGLACLWRSNGIARDVTGLILSGGLLATALISALFFDAFLSPLLVFATMPVLRASVLGVGQKVASRS
ncbi:hypothetical protein VVD49_20955 [Uliginosibacterium sp. H3]|uniref:Uncharacterized protein n=1 Tax=Uliginosibacterium silvisoli TaxID=3114758 RepID=A0ABU6K8L0_9RHOO|nr:hypothetical protein [Uliginosibacterium sp. H3]